jgi:hypothetical protein
VQLERMHDEAHHGCFIANSVRTEITIAAPSLAMLAGATEEAQVGRALLVKPSA